MRVLLDNPLFQAVAGGVLVYFVGIVFERLYITPLVKYNELRSEICYCLTEYADAYMNPAPNTKEISGWHTEASAALRRIASKTSAFSQERKFLAKPAIPPTQNLKEIARWLFALSNSMIDPSGTRIASNRKDANAIRLYLKLDVESYDGLANWVSDKHYQRECFKRVKSQDNCNNHNRS